MAKTLGYRPNLAARYLSSRHNLRISVNTLQGTTSFWDEVRAGISEEARALVMENIEIEYRTYPRLGEGEEEAFEAALKSGVDGIITFPSRPQRLLSRMRRASRNSVPVVCVATDAPNTGRLAVVSIDTLASGSLAADLMGSFLGGKGKVAVTLSSLAITEHAEKRKAFASTLHDLYPQMQLQETIEDHDIETEAHEKSMELFKKHPDLAGIYVTTEASIPVLNAARGAHMLDRITFITTDLFPALVPEIRSRAVAATIYQRPRTRWEGASSFLGSMSAPAELALSSLMNTGASSHQAQQGTSLSLRRSWVGRNSLRRIGGELAKWRFDLLSKPQERAEMKSPASASPGRCMARFCWMPTMT
jgi:LacI family transcriptional regulator